MFRHATVLAHKVADPAHSTVDALLQDFLVLHAVTGVARLPKFVHFCFVIITLHFDTIYYLYPRCRTGDRQRNISWTENEPTDW